MINEAKFEKYEPDSSRWVWNNFYNKTYREVLYWKSLNSEKANGKYVKSGYNYTSHTSIEIGGDVIFNFKGDYGKKFGEEIKELYSKTDYVKMQHSILNFSFMPVTGALNLNKANGKYCDRFDRFLYYLDLYIKEKNNDNPLLGIRGRNKQTVSKLKEYLKSFNSIDEYCEVYYLIDETNIIQDLINSGKSYIHNGVTFEGSKRYLELARNFWEYRYNLFENTYKLDVVKLDDGMDLKNLDL